MDEVEIITRTLRQIAFQLPDEKSRDQVLETAQAVEHAAATDSLYELCPVCEESDCDDDCPLAELRSTLRSTPL